MINRIPIEFIKDYGEGFNRNSKTVNLIFEELKSITKNYKEARFRGDLPAPIRVLDPLDLVLKKPQVFETLKKVKNPEKILSVVKKHFRSLRASYEYSKINLEVKQAFVRKVKTYLLNRPTVLLENDYPYSIFRKNGCGHYVLWGTDSLSIDMLEGSKRKFGFDYNDIVFYFSNKNENKSVPEVSHIHIIAFNPSSFSLEE